MSLGDRRERWLAEEPADDLGPFHLEVLRHLAEDEGESTDAEHGVIWDREVVLAPF
jgi:hypothetical protein